MGEGKERGVRKTRAERLHEKRLTEIRREFSAGRMSLLLGRYLAYCGVGEACEEDGESEKRTEKSGKAVKRLPNPAGFCRFYSLDREDFTVLSREFPKEIGRMRAVFEDEALNSAIPASVLGFYLKDLLGTEAATGDGGEGSIVVSFEHDILSDGR